jgi:hypothetical protein
VVKPTLATSRAKPVNRPSQMARSLGGGAPKTRRVAAGWAAGGTCSWVVPDEPASQPAQRVWVPGVTVAGMVAVA